MPVRPLMLMVLMEDQEAEVGLTVQTQLVLEVQVIHLLLVHLKVITVVQEIDVLDHILTEVAVAEQQQ